MNEKRRRHLDLRAPFSFPLSEYLTMMKDQILLDDVQWCERRHYTASSNLILTNFLEHSNPINTSHFIRCTQPSTARLQ